MSIDLWKKFQAWWKEENPDAPFSYNESPRGDQKSTEPVTLSDKFGKQVAALHAAEKGLNAKDYELRFDQPTMFTCDGTFYGHRISWRVAVIADGWPMPGCVLTYADDPRFQSVTSNGSFKVELVQQFTDRPSLTKAAEDVLARFHGSDASQAYRLVVKYYVRNESPTVERAVVVDFPPGDATDFIEYRGEDHPHPTERFDLRHITCVGSKALPGRHELDLVRHQLKEAGLIDDEIAAAKIVKVDDPSPPAVYTPPESTPGPHFLYPPDAAPDAVVTTLPAEYTFTSPRPQPDFAAELEAIDAKLMAIKAGLVETADLLREIHRKLGPP